MYCGGGLAEANGDVADSWLRNTPKKEVSAQATPNVLACTSILRTSPAMATLTAVAHWLP